MLEKYAKRVEEKTPQGLGASEISRFFTQIRHASYHLHSTVLDTVIMTSMTDTWWYQRAVSSIDSTVAQGIITYRGRTQKLPNKHLCEKGEHSLTTCFCHSIAQVNNPTKSDVMREMKEMDFEACVQGEKARVLLTESVLRSFNWSAGFALG